MEAVLELEASLNGKGKSHAASLIKGGKVSESKSWSGPSAGTENAYLESHSWEEYGTWFLGKDPEADPESKAHWKYPFSDDFKTVSVNGLRAIRGRAAQTGEAGIFDAAGPLLDAVKEKLGLEGDSNFLRLQTQIDAPHAFRSVDVELGRMADVSILEEGVAAGHNVLITQKTLEEAAKVLQGKSLPAYITHANAQGDRLTTEVGFFSGFYLSARRDSMETSKLKARTFQTFQSFKKYQPETYEKLFEMAETLPDNFGISLVFEARLFWQMNDGTEMDFEGWEDAPAGAMDELPTVEVLKVLSADFVDNPAANSSLFSKPQNQIIMKTELTTAASEKLEKAPLEVIETSEQPVKASDESAIEEPPKKKRRKKLDVESADDGEEYIEDLETRLNERDKLINSLSEKIEYMEKELSLMRKLMEGEEALPEDAAEESTEEMDVQILKRAAVSEIMEMNEGISRSAALLEVGKKHPEYFNN